MISGLWAGALLAELVAVGKLSGKAWLGSRSQQKELERSLTRAESWLSAKTSAQERELLAALGAEQMKTIAFAIRDLSNDLEGKELRAMTHATLKAVDFFEENVAAARSLAPKLYEAVIRAAASSQLPIAPQARILLQQGVVAQQNQTLNQIVEHSQGMARSTLALQMALSPFGSEPLPAPSQAPRSGMVRELAGLIRTHAWLAFVGASGSGKSQLALLCAAGKSSRWVHLRGQDPDQANQIVSQLRIQSDLEKGTLLVLDDLPRVQEGSALADELARLAERSKELGFAVLSLSYYSLPQALQERISCDSVSCPPFEEADVEHVLAASGCPLKIQKPLAGICLLATRGNPFLTSNAVAYLASRNWEVSNQAIAELFEGRSDESASSEIIQRVVNTVEDDHSRDLLYRLCLIDGEFGKPEMIVCSEADPAIHRPMEAFHGILGTWVEELSGARYRLAPLLELLPQDTLLPDGRKAVFEKLAKWLWSQKTLTPFQLRALSGYCLKAGDSRSAANALLIALGGLHQHEEQQTHFGLLSFWSDSDIPGDVSDEAAILLCAYQTVLRERFNLSYSENATELARRAREISDDSAWALAGMVGALGKDLLRIDPIVVATCLERVTRSDEIPVLPDGTELRLPQGTDVASLPLVIALWVSTAHEAEAIAGVISRNQIAPKDDQSLEESAVFRLVDGIQESCETKDEWRAVSRTLKSLAEAGHRAGWEFLEFRAVRSLAILTAEHLNDVAGATSLLGEQKPKSEVAKFLIHDARARVLLVDGKPEESLPHFAWALENDDPRLTALWIGAALDGSFAQSDPHKAIEWISDALSRSEQSEWGGNSSFVRMNAELALRKAQVGDREGGFASLVVAMRLLDQESLTSNVMSQGIAVLLWNICTYVSLKLSGRDAQTIGFQVPQPGQMYQNATKAAAIYTENRAVVAARLLALLALTAEDTEEAERWTQVADRTAELTSSRVQGDRFMALPTLAALGRWEALVEAAANEEGTDRMTPLNVFVPPLAAVPIALQNDRAGASQLAAELRKYSQELAAPFDLFTQNAPPEEIIKAAGERDDLGLFCGCLLLASVSTALQPGTALGYQLNAIMHGERMWLGFAPADTSVLVPNLLSFWTAYVHRARFLFRVPDVVLEQLAATRDRAPQEWTKHILKTIAEGLGVSVAPQLKEWLYREPNSGT